MLVLVRLKSIINFKNKKSNLINFARGSLVILLIYVWPIKTSGSFFTTFNGSFFWFNLGLAMLLINNFSKARL